MYQVYRRSSAWRRPARAAARGKNLLGALLLAAAISGCDSMSREPAPQLTGTFSGVAPDGHTVTVSLVQTENRVTGRGKWGDQDLSLSALTAPQGPLVVSMEGGAVIPGFIALSADGATITVRGFGKPITLDRSGAPVAVAPGPFTGHYATGGPLSLRLSLEQTGDLLAGIGFVRGRPVAVAGRMTGPNEARGSILFSDESQNDVTVSLSDDNQVLSIRGLGGVIQMERQ